MYRLWWGKALAHAHISVNNQYISTTRCNLIKMFVHHTTEAVCVCGGVLYRDRQYFHCGVLDLVSWVLLVSTSKQKPVKQMKHFIRSFFSYNLKPNLLLHWKTCGWSTQDTLAEDLQSVCICPCKQVRAANLASWSSATHLTTVRSQVEHKNKNLM